MVAMNTDVKVENNEEEFLLKGEDHIRSKYLPSSHVAAIQSLFKRNIFHLSSSFDFFLQCKGIFSDLVFAKQEIYIFPA